MISFTGITSIEKATVVKGRGVKPALATLTCLPQATLPPTSGQLVITDGTNQEVWQDAAVLYANRKHVSQADIYRTKGHKISVQVADRRWRWSQRTISGVYNTRLDDGTVSATNKKSVQELVTIIFQALGETVDASAVPADLYPPINWVAERCDRALQRLLTSVGCEIALNYGSNQAVAYNRGTGAQLPANGREMEPPVVMTAGPAPDKLKIAGGPVLVQSKIKLEAVGLDTDGSIKRINDLSYKPAAGWGLVWPLDFEDVSNATGNALARQTVWKWWAIKEFANGGLSIPQISTAITKPTQLLPLRERLLEADADHNSVQRQNFPYLEGTSIYTDTTHARFTGGFRILYDQGIVVTDDPVFTLTSSGISEPSMYLTVAHHVRDATTDGLVVYDRERSLGAGNSEVTEVVPELFRTITRLYSGTGQTSVTDNKATVDAEADKYLNAMQTRYAPVDPPRAMMYRSITLADLDGAIAQVKHVLGSGEAHTVISRNYEDDVFSPSERQRALVMSMVAVPNPNLSTPSPRSGAPQNIVHVGDGRVTGTLSKLGSQTCRIWVRISGTMTDTGIDITVHDTLLKTAATLTDKWRVVWEWRNDRYVVVGAACQADTSSTVWGT